MSPRHEQLRLQIAMIGLRGLPASFGGIERHVEELGARLVDRGHEVVVYTRPSYTEAGLRDYRGMRLVSLRSPRMRGTETFVHSGLAAMATVGSGFDIAHYHALGPGLFTPVSRAFTGAAVVQTIHGLDYARDKWSGVAPRILKAGGWLSSRVPGEVIVVSRDLANHYKEAYGCEATYIPNGAPRPTPADVSVLKDAFGLSPGDFVVFLGRLVPEKDPMLLLKAYREVRTSKRLVIVGDSCDTDRYVAELHEQGRHDDRVMFVGFRYGTELASLLGHAALFVQPSRLEGLPISLLEAAAYGRPIVASDIPPHAEVIAQPGVGKQLFRAGDLASLARAIQEALDGPEELLEGARKLHDDVVLRYDWDVATDQLEASYQKALRARRTRRWGRVA